MSNQSTTTQKSKSNAVTFLVVAIVFLCVIAAIGQCGSDETEDSSDGQKADPQGQAAIDAVQEMNTSLATNMHQSVGVVLAILESQGHTQRIDGWYVSKASDHYAVYFYFYVDGDRQFAEWWYSPETKAIDPINDWAFVFMGQ